MKIYVRGGVIMEHKAREYIKILRVDIYLDL